MKSQSRSSFEVPASLRRSTLILGLALVAGCLVSCRTADDDHFHDDDDDDRPLESFTEIEPNDSPDFPDFIGFIDRDVYLDVDGSVEAVGIDIVDHIEFEPVEPMEIDFVLESFGPFADVDVSIYDPIDDVIVGTYATDGRIESGTIIVHDFDRPFQFVIEAFDTDSDWLLTIEGYPYGGWLTEGEGDGDGAAAMDSPTERGAAEERPAFELKRIPGEVRTREEQFELNRS